MHWSRLPLAQREADVHRVLAINEADTSTFVNNLISERMQSRRRKVTQNDDNMRMRTMKVKDRLRRKLAARKKALSEKQNDARPTKTHAQKPRQRPGQAQGKSKASSCPPQKVLAKGKKKCRTHARK